MKLSTLNSSVIVTAVIKAVRQDPVLRSDLLGALGAAPARKDYLIRKEDLPAHGFRSWAELRSRLIHQNGPRGDRVIAISKGRLSIKASQLPRQI